MDETRYELTAAQAAFLAKAGSAAPGVGRTHSRPAKVRFPGALPPVTDQAVRGTCVANAVAALVACYEGCRRRVSVQYLDEVTRLVEQAWVARNLKVLAVGEPVEKDFEAAFPEAVSQAALLVRANGAGSEAAAAFVRALGAKIRSRIEADAGCRLRHCFEALEEYGACREELWPYSPVALNRGAAGGDAVGAFPPGTHEDARRHRIVNGLYVLRAPNNVDEIKGVLAGAQGRRPMPVCAGLELFEGRTDGAFLPPDIVRENDRAFAVQRPTGIHEVLITGYTDDAKAPGGGFFTFRNSWGRDWGEAGMGRVSYAYVACFCREAGTILQEPDDYGPGAAPRVRDEAFVVRRRRLTILCAVGLCLAAAAASIAVAVWAVRMAESARQPLPEPTTRPAPVQPAQPQPQQPVPSKPVPPSPTNDDDIVIEKVRDYRFLVRGTCDSTSEATRMAYALDGEHRDFTFDNVRLTDDRHGFEGEMTVEGACGRKPDALRKIEDYFKRRKLNSAVRKWSVRDLR